MTLLLTVLLLKQEYEIIEV